MQSNPFLSQSSQKSNPFLQGASAVQKNNPFLNSMGGNSNNQSAKGLNESDKSAGQNNPISSVKPIFGGPPNGGGFMSSS